MNEVTYIKWYKSIISFCSETALSHDLVEYIQYCDAISDLIKRYEIVQYQQEKNEAKRADLEKEKYEIESGGGKAFSLKGVTRAIMGSGSRV